MLTEQIEDIADLAEDDPKDKKAEFHRNLKIAATSLVIIAFGMSVIINFYTLRKIMRK